LQPLANPTDPLIDAAHKAASFDDIWAINSRRDFKRAVKAMLAASVIKQNSPTRIASKKAYRGVNILS
jgi:hypothetical protein